MTTHIALENSVAEENNVQFIPCSIDYDGRAKVSSYFKERADSDGVKIASFRGRPLIGSDIQLPEGYCGYVIRKAEASASDSQVHNVQQSFKKITYWNLDRVPSNNDAIVSALDWINLSTAIHDKVNPEDLVKDSNLTNGQCEKKDVETERTNGHGEINTPNTEDAKDK